LITGGAGFLGSHLCEALLQRGHDVICVDNLLTSSKDNIAHLIGRPDFEFFEHDVTEYIDIQGSIDHILHFASPASPADYLQYPIQTLKVGSLGTHNSLGLARVKKARYLLASTSEVYGDPEVNPQPESYWGNVNPVGRRGVYDEAKRFAEALVMAYHRYHQLDTRIARIFNTYGPGMRLDDGRALPNFIMQALTGRDVVVFGTGEQTRSFGYVDDTVEGICRLLESDETRPVNIGDPTEIPVRQLAEEIIALCRSSSKIVTVPLPDGYQDDPKVRRPDISRARESLDWEPHVARRDGLERSIEDFRNRLHAKGDPHG